MNQMPNLKIRSTLLIYLVWISSIACSLPTALKNLVETTIPNTPTIPPSSTATEITYTPTPFASPTYLSETASSVPPEQQATATGFATIPIPTPTATQKRPPVVLWDLSHGPRLGETGVYEPKGVFSALVSLIKENGVSIVGSNQSLDQVDLSNYAAMVVSMSSAVEKDFSQAEAQRINQFVRQGGSLLILGETPNFSNRIQPVLDLFNLQVSNRLILGEIIELQNHPVFAGVSQVQFLFGGCSFVITAPPAKAVGLYDGEPVIIAVEQFPGRVLVIGDSNLFDNRGLPKNRQFGINVFLWLTDSS